MVDEHHSANPADVIQVPADLIAYLDHYRGIGRQFGTSTYSVDQ